MKKSFKIKKSVVESMVDNAIRSLLNEGVDASNIRSNVYGRMCNWAPDTFKWFAEDIGAKGVTKNEFLDTDFGDIRYKKESNMSLKLIFEDPESVKSFIESVNSFDGDYYARQDGENSVLIYCLSREEGEIFETKESRTVEDMKKKIRSMSQKISSTDEELPELKRQLDSLKNKLSTMDESFKSKKLKDFARQHGGLKNGKWSADFKNDLYNMSDEDFDTYKVVNQNDHYRQYGLNWWDTNGYGNNNFQPIEFGDGTFMVKKNPELRWDDRAKDMMDKQIDRRNSRRNDGKNEYQFENPYLNDKFNQEYHISKPRGSWGYGTDWKLEPSNINMTALRRMEGYDKYPGDVQHGDVAAKAKASRKANVSESKLNNAIQKSIKKILNESDIWDIGGYRAKYESEKQATEQFAKEILSGMYDEKLLDENDAWLVKKLSHVSDDDAQYIIACVNKRMGKLTKKGLNEGIYDYPDGIDNIIFLSENDRELYNEYRQIAKACMKLYKKDVQLTLERLMESSIMKAYQQHCFKKYAKEQKGLDRMNSPREFRRFIAEKIIDEVVNGQWDDREMMNEYYTDDPNDGYDYETGKPYYPGVYGYYYVKPEGVPTEVEYAQNTRNKQTGWTKQELDNRDKMMDRYIQGKRSEDDIDDAWYGIHAFESKLNEEMGQPKQYGYQNVPDDFVEKVGENGYDVLVPDWCLPYLVNGDRDMYEDDEIAAMDAFVEKYNGKLAHNLYVGDACIPMDGEEPSFYTHNDITGNEGCDCYRVFLPAKESKSISENVSKNNTINISSLDEITEEMLLSGEIIEIGKPLKKVFKQASISTIPLEPGRTFVGRALDVLGYRIITTYENLKCLKVKIESDDGASWRMLNCVVREIILPQNIFKQSSHINEGVFPRVKDKVVQNLEWIKIPDNGWFDGGMSCGIIDHEKKTVTPCHGYYFPNPKSRVLRNIAKRLGYKYNDEEFEKYTQKKQNNKKS